jgi:hypothetical protein
MIKLEKVLAFFGIARKDSNPIRLPEPSPAEKYAELCRQSREMHHVNSYFTPSSSTIPIEVYNKMMGFCS